MNTKKNQVSLRNIFQRILLLSIFSFFSNIAIANDECFYITFDGWKECFIQTKLHNEPSDKALDLLEKAKISDRVIELDKKQPESTMDFKNYLTHIGFNSKVTNGKEFIKSHRELLNVASKQFGVEPEIIVALVGMESDYGKIQGKFNVIDSLASLAFDGRRRELFENQLLAAITIAEEDNLSYPDFKGSWAGAMGWCQFMPTSFRQYAVDMDGDGFRNIWSSKQDIFASAANYLKNNGWEIGAGKIAKFNKKTNNSDNKDYLDTSICDESAKLCKLDENLYLLFQENDGILAPTFLVGKNFNVLMKWNRSYYFCLSVLMIADQLKKA